RLLLLAVSILFALPVAANAQKRCRKGIPCGNTCIAANKTCRAGMPAYAPPPSQLSPPAQAEPDTSRAWVASSRGHAYYKHGRSGANRLTPSNRVHFRTEEEAQRAGYRRSTPRGC